MDITLLSAPFPQMLTKVASDGTFSQDTTVQGYAIHYEGKVEVQPGAQHKFIITGTFTSNGSSNGTFVLRSLDWQAFDGVKAQMAAGGDGVPPRIAFANETLGFASWWASVAPTISDTASSYLWRTDDGGSTWNPAATVSGAVTDMRFAAGKLWVATDTGLWSSQDQGLSFTTDGGANFRDIPEITESVASIKVMPDGSGILVSGDRLFSTSDGGATWTALPPLVTGTTGLVPVSTTEWWTWTSMGLEHVSQSGAVRELVLVRDQFTELRATSDALWASLDPSSWLVLPLTGGAPQVVSTPGPMWPLSRTTLVAEVQNTIDHPGLQFGLGLSTDGGQTWKNILGLTDVNWTVCPVDASRAWIAGNGAYYLLENGSAQLVFTDPSGRSPDQVVYCDPGRLWFLDNGTPKLLAGGVLTEQAVPMEWKSSKVSALVNGQTLASAVSESAAWLALTDGRTCAS